MFKVSYTHCTLYNSAHSLGLHLFFYGLFTSPTGTRQNCLIWSASAVWTQLETRQNCLVLSAGVYEFCSHRQLDKTRQFCLVRVGGVNKPLAANWKLGRDKTKLSCLVRVGGENWTSHYSVLLRCATNLCWWITINIIHNSFYTHAYYKTNFRDFCITHIRCKSRLLLCWNFGHYTTCIFIINNNGYKSDNGDDDDDDDDDAEKVQEYS